MKSKIIYILTGLLFLTSQSCKDELSGITNTNRPRFNRSQEKPVSIVLLKEVFISMASVDIMGQ